MVKPTGFGEPSLKSGPPTGQYAQPAKMSRARKSLFRDNLQCARLFHAMVNDQPVAVAESLFRAFATLIPKFMQISEKCGVDLVEIFTLWYVRHNGKTRQNQNPEEEVILLQAELTRLLRKEFGYTPQNVDRLLKRLEDKRLLRRTGRLDPVEHEILFGTSTGRKDTVTLLTAGSEKVEEFKKEIVYVFTSVFSSMPKGLLQVLSPVLQRLVKMAAWVTSQYATPKSVHRA